MSRRDLTKELYVDLLERVHAAELVQFVMDLVEDEGLVVVSRVVLHYVIHWAGRRGSRIREGRAQNFLRQQLALRETWG